ncbi:hypothetical protein [Curtobacterium sp. MCBD17_040]|uniref:hypothetical protein n=1 Tax=Curtobacterium sp. MCBD17_040 TaxID=2175674 RepID=UPI000DA9C644|nr:hypothetical protein [Curtobacterium sp. MCBD17_040]WIB65922.1 hypothetical protein DEI94_17555 [Curtobacterium sp. MCBD17_040]
MRDQLVQPLTAGVLATVILLCTALITWAVLNVRVRRAVNDDTRFQVAYAFALAQQNTTPDKYTRTQAKQQLHGAHAAALTRGAALRAATVRDRVTAAHMVLAVAAGITVACALLARA